MATIPANIGSHKVGIKTHIIDTDITLPLSKSAMKKGEIELKLSNDTINFLKNETPLNTPSSGLYHFPLTTAKQLLEKVNNNNEHDLIVLDTTENNSNKEIALKLICTSFCRKNSEIVKQFRNGVV